MAGQKHATKRRLCFTRSGTLLFLSASLCTAEVLIPAGDPNINYYGRFDAASASQVRFNWSGAAIEASFPGPSIGIQLQDGQADYDVEIDGLLDTILKTVSTTTHYTINTNLSAGAHTIRIMQRSENHWNAVVFGGLYLADGKTLLAAPDKPLRKIEFIGDSYTVGYGNESTSRTCTSQQFRATTNTNKSFGPLITKAFHAQSIVLGYSGLGMVRNYGDAARQSTKPYPYYYGTTLGDVGGNWNFSQWIPDLVVICLGTNDFSTTPNPDDTTFIRAYHSFINSLRGNYPSTPIMCVTTHTGPLDSYLQKIVAAETTSVVHKQVYYAEFPLSLELTGCDYHPSVADDEAIAKALVAAIMKSVGWDTAAASVGIACHLTRTVSRYLSVTPAGITGDILITTSPEVNPASALEITDLQGRLVARGNFDRKHTFLWRTATTPPGCYLIGAPGIGWTKTMVKRR